MENSKEINERNFELMEFSLFVASLGKERLDESTKAVRKLRKLEKEGKIDLEQYENLADSF